jgi:CheY-like chemotaxis protein
MTEQHTKILIVDDDTFLLNMYSMKFSKNGFEVQTAQNGADALKKIKDGNYTPDIMLFDVIMPGIDGIELLTEIRKQNLTPDATIVMLTNQSDTGDIDRAKALKVNGYIVKATTIPSEVISQVQQIHQDAHKK